MLSLLMEWTVLSLFNSKQQYVLKQSTFMPFVVVMEEYANPDLTNGHCYVDWN